MYNQAGIKDKVENGEILIHMVGNAAARVDGKRDGDMVAAWIHPILMSPVHKSSLQALCLKAFCSNVIDARPICFALVVMVSSSSSRAERRYMV